MKAETRTQHKLTRTPSDPDIALYDDKEITPLELDQLDTLRTALLSYHDALDAVGLPDERVRRDAPQSTLSLLYGALLRALWAVLLLVLAAPGTVVLSPLLLCGKGLEMWIILTNRGARRVRNLDEVAAVQAISPATDSESNQLYRHFMPFSSASNSSSATHSSTSSATASCYSWRHCTDVDVTAMARR
eukprot:6707-Heterococcus_DN1.PRE.1